MRENKSPKTIKNHRNGLHQRVFKEKSNVQVIGDDQKYILHPRKSPPTQLQKIGSALFYAVCSICIVFVNKSVLTIYHFPSAQILGNSLTKGKYSLIPSTRDLFYRGKIRAVLWRSFEDKKVKLKKVWVK